MARHNEIGIRGEEIAMGHLSALSYEILERNWRYGRFEIDIIARLKDELIIAEVKTRVGNFAEFPQDSVNLRKQNRLIRAANAYIWQANLNLDVRFDIITVVFENNSVKVNHIENAFYPIVRS